MIYERKIHDVVRIKSKRKFGQWSCHCPIDIKTPLTLIKPLHVKWIIDMYDQLTSEKGKEIVMSGWRASGILNAVLSSSESIQQLDPFSRPRVHYIFRLLRNPTHVPESRPRKRK